MTKTTIPVKEEVIEIEEGAVTLVFPREYGVMKYDESKFFKEKFRKIQSTKAVDFVCVTSDTAWLIELKDYRRCDNGKIPKPPKPSQLADVVVQKVRDTLAGLAAASANDRFNDEKEIAQRALADAEVAGSTPYGVT